MNLSFGVLILVIVVAVAFFAYTVRIVPQSRSYVIERLGKYHATWESGLHVLIPGMDRIAKIVSTKEQTLDFEPQYVITQESVKISVDSLVFFRIVNAQAYCYGVENAEEAMSALATSTMRNIIGNLDLESCLTSRDDINSRITSELDKATDKWGIKVLRVEVKNIMPPRDIQDAMDRQMKADRGRRETIIIAEGERAAKILRAQTEKEATILKAEADKTAAQLNAEADLITRVKRAEANKISELLKAEAAKTTTLMGSEAEAQSILNIQKANAEAIRMINEANPSESVLRIKAYEALVSASNGNATTLIIPSELQSIVGLASTVKTALVSK